MDLPAPESEVIHRLVTNEVSRRIYAVLYAAKPQPLSIDEIRELIDLESGDIQQHLDRRLRSLDPFFDIKRGRDGRNTTYTLSSRREKVLQAAGAISKKVRAYVLRNQRCAQCGRTPEVDGVRLHVDHKVPQSWGGTNNPENLQALCSECNEGSVTTTRRLTVKTQRS